jgi:MoaA/NifB/PqqE/SkfB family radical SAM enzyme
LHQQDSLMDTYLSQKMVTTLPRLPLEGHLDLTYRCNNACLHCWLWKPPNALEQQDELTFDEIRRIVDQARSLGTCRWSISGGEPMLRADFPEIFDYLTRKAASFSLNTNGTLITPEIAQLLRRKGTKMIALYGATADVYDLVTRSSGGFEKVMRGFEYMKQAGAGFTVQLIPMRANWHQWDQMQELARSLSPHWRVGAAWLYFSCDGSHRRNAEIAAQRLAPEEVIALDQPNPGYEERMGEILMEPRVLRDLASFDGCTTAGYGDDRLFARCIANRRDFHIDAYGMMSFCSFIKDPALRYDLRRGNFREAWDEFIPALADQVRGGEEWRAHCGACEKRSDCRWCAVYAYLETGRFSAPIPYLCRVANEARRFKAEWQDKHRRYFKVAGITVRVESDLDFDSVSFKEELQAFAVESPGDDNVTLRHHFELPDLNGKDLGVELYRKPPWAISRKNDTWFYLGISPTPGDPELHRVAVFSADHRHATIYSPPRDAEHIRISGWHSLSLFPTDQIWLAPLLADRNAVLLHSAAVILNGQGLLFVGHSDAGKSTTVTLLKERAEILCDDRNIVRRWKDGWQVHGTWSHGDVADVSPASTPLGAILFLQQDSRNAIVSLTDRKEIWRLLLATLIKPMVTAEWWRKEMDVLEQIVNEAPCYTMHFDRGGGIVDELDRLLQEG